MTVKTSSQKPRKKKKGHSVVILESDEGQSYDAPRPNKEELTVGQSKLTDNLGTKTGTVGYCVDLSLISPTY